MGLGRTLGPPTVAQPPRSDAAAAQQESAEAGDHRKGEPGHGARHCRGCQRQGAGLQIDDQIVLKQWQKACVEVITTANFYHTRLSLMVEPASKERKGSTGPSPPSAGEPPPKPPSPPTPARLG